MQKQPDDPGVFEKDPFDFDEIKLNGWDVTILGGVAFVFMVIVLIVAMMIPQPAQAHSWYPWECCAGNDCAEVSPLAVKETQAGYVFTIVPGHHPMWPASKAEPLTILVRHNKLKPSPDGLWHICIKPTGELICAWGIVGGV